MLSGEIALKNNHYYYYNIMHAYLLLFAALSYAACLYIASLFLLLIFPNAFCFHTLS